MEKRFGVATKAIIENGEGKFLVLFKSNDEDINPNEIDIPGGRIEFAEEPDACLVREVKEETDLDIKVIKPTRVWSLVKEDFQLIGITYLVELIGGDISLSGEHDAYRWMTKEEIINGEYPKWIKKEFAGL